MVTFNSDGVAEYDFYLDGTVDFYTNILGFTCAGVNDDWGWAMLHFDEGGELKRARAAGIPAVGYFAQVPHYVSGPYPAASVELLVALGRHLDVVLPTGDLIDEAQQLRTRLDTATALEESAREYVERLELLVDEQRLPSGDDLIGEIERFLREGGTEGRSRG